ncbi:hypothetical protein [Legionella israelensis]|uniref:UDP-3-O-[3-hydroxymyristoyl] glucosamine N-acyltransferase n=1 Tax=Legionella israelensis TaxID=454 RepID=A0A0W0WNT1_9GAMM|nr:hypothetical protein [Legionella israelensis]KTD33982.1 UDP-3-O-[3-hydroxymyristoyl] glucosamine N-acyltransferase [Legionella israelensis]QBS10682.1 hypothetical protein E4T55_13015 [Legionella israelensis]SCX83794.1 UDP-3-O-[3-hydroxymyristoyl] glucosamine N-acyltransferase [Legionella israelensis DSM 19235]STX57638.1 UDP-3-O-[3-hydroxymyristoyl] glucosamine N-acyltransferase [Legionella israelensis]
MYSLANFFQEVSREGFFSQTQFANTPEPNSLCFAASKKYLIQANRNDAISSILTTVEFADLVSPGKGLVVLKEPEEAFYTLHNHLVSNCKMQPRLTPFIDSSARVHSTAYLDPYVWIGPNVEIGPGAIILSGSILRDNAVIGPNAVVGASGHFYKRYKNQLLNVLHAGGVLLEESVQVLAGAVISKSLHTDFTTIGKNSIISVKAHVGHGCKIGERCIITGNAQISGYTQIGDDVWIGPSATIGNLLKIDSKVRIETGSVVVEDLKEGERVSGSFAIKHCFNMMEYTKRKRGAR